MAGLALSEDTKNPALGGAPGSTVCRATVRGETVASALKEFTKKIGIVKRKMKIL
jgi:hypothetical protein